MRASWLAALLSQVDTYGYDGLALDFEAGAASDRAAMTSFVTDLAAALHARGKRLTQAVSAKSADSLTHPRSGIFDYPALSAVADTLFVMAWGIHWSTSAPGASDDLPWLTGVVDYVATMPNPSKFALGAHLYAMDWPAGGGPSNPGHAMEYADVVNLFAATGATPVRDTTSDSYHFSYVDGNGVSHDVWFGDVATVRTRMQLAQSRGLGGVGFWRLGREDQRLWGDAMLAPGSSW
jgi:spore germination protein YaaH